MAKQETELQELIINYLPYEEYKAAKEAGEINPNELYCTPDDEVNPPSMISDEFDPNKTYAVGDYCIAYNKLWRCLVQCQGVYPAEGTYWTACTVGEEMTKAAKKTNGISDAVRIMGEIAANTNINNIKTVGCYIQNSDNNAATCSNMPVNRAGKLYVVDVSRETTEIGTQSWQYYVQIFFTYEASLYIRRLRTESSTAIIYGSWVQKF